MNEIKRTGFFTSQTKVIQALIEIHCNLLIGKPLHDVQEVVKNYDTKFESIDSSRRIHSLMYKDEGGSIEVDDIKEVEGKGTGELENNMGGNAMKESNYITENVDNINNIPPQPILPNED